ncbi:MAG: general stress protein, partial [Polyangiaceae bacterium]
IGLTQTPRDRQVSLRTYDTYGEAQRVVDTLADRWCEVETTQIIGSNLRMDEQVTCRRSWLKAVLAQRPRRLAGERCGADLTSLR